MLLKFKSLTELLIFNIKYYRYLNNMSQEKLAEQSGLSPRYFSDIERGRHYPTIPKIELIARALNIEPHMLFQNCERDKNIVKSINISRQYNQTRKKKK